MSPQVEAVTSRLQRTRSHWRTFSLGTALMLAASISLVILALFVLADAILKLPQRVLVGLFATWLALSLAASSFLLARLRRGNRTLAATARRVELAFPELESQLINIVQFADAADPFRQSAVVQAAAAVAGVQFDQAATRESRWQRFALCVQTPRDLLDASLVLAAVLGFGLLMHAVVPTWASSTRRLLHPFEFVPSVGSTRIAEVRPGDAELLIGSNLPISARIDRTAGKGLSATLFVRPAGQPESALAMLPGEDNLTYLAAVPQVMAPLEYRLQIGDSQTRLYGVSIYEKPTIRDVEVTYAFPAYLDRPRETVKQNHADLEAPQFTEAELKIHPSTPIARGHLLVGDRAIEGRVTDDGRTMLARWRLDETTMFTVRLFTAAGHTDPQPRIDRVKVQVDAPPVVQLVEPARETRAALGSKPQVVVRASDDFGLGLVRIETRSDAEVRTLASWSRFASSGVLLSHALALDPARFKAGQTVWVRAVAEDRRRIDLSDRKLGPQQSATPWQAIQIEAPEVKAKADAAQLDALRTAMAKILQDQLHARAAAAGFNKLGSEGEAGTLAADLRGRQAAIQKATAAMVESIGTTDDPDRLVIRRVAGKLATGEMVRAIRQAEAMEHGSGLAELARPTAELTATQDKIVNVLRRLLGEVRREEAERLAELKKRRGPTCRPTSRASWRTSGTSSGSSSCSRRRSSRRPRTSPRSRSRTTPRRTSSSSRTWRRPRTSGPGSWPTSTAT